MTLGSISTVLLCLVSHPPSGEERGLISRTAAGNRAYYEHKHNHKNKNTVSEDTYNTRT